jgi:hypothetical protein
MKRNLVTRSGATFSWMAAALVAAGCGESEESPRTSAQDAAHGSTEAIGTAEQEAVVEGESAIADATIREVLGFTKFGSRTTLRVGPPPTERALVQFDAASILETLHDEVQLDSATLVLRIVHIDALWLTGENVSVHRMTVPWTEASTSWRCASGAAGLSCATPWYMGGDLPGTPVNPVGPLPYIATPIATTPIASLQTGDVAFDVTPLIQELKTSGDPEVLRGLLIRKQNEAQLGAITFSSREGANPPRLVLEYHSACDPLAVSQDPCKVTTCTEDGPSTVNAPAGTSCADETVCNGAETCDGAGVCQPGTALVLDDSNPCTIDSCDPLSGPVHEPSVGASCADDDVCNGAETCDGSGVCQPGTPLVVDDGNPCTGDACDPILGIT